MEDSVTNLDQSTEIEVENEQPQPAGIKLRRSGYYTIPNMSELGMISHKKVTNNNFWSQATFILA